MAFVLIASCRRASTTPNESVPTTQPAKSVTSRPIEDFYERTTTHFALADFLKPSGDGVPEEILAMSPLIVREAPGRFSDQPLGVSIEAADWKAEGNRDSTTVIYYHEDETTIGGKHHRRLAFLWLVQKRGESEFRLMRLQGFRMTLDEAGFALLWELMEHRSPRILYVAQSLEDAAAAEFGPPEPRRRYSIELPIETAPETVVARVLADGPQPMGPFVYLDGETAEITTLLCRCMPSQVSEFRKNEYFELRRLPPPSDNPSVLISFYDRLREFDAEPLSSHLRMPSRPGDVP